MVGWRLGPVRGWVVHLLDPRDLRLAVPLDRSVGVAVPARLVDVEVDVVGRDRRGVVADALDEACAARAEVVLQTHRPAVGGGRRTELGAVLVTQRALRDR